VNQVWIAQSVIGNPELTIDIAQKLESSQLGVKDKCNTISVFIKMRKECPQDSRFAGANLTGYFDKTGPVFDSLDQMSVNFVMGFAEKKETRVRCQGKGVFLECKKRFIHKPYIPRQSVIRYENVMK
jgi:hypothetical protein